MLWISQQKPAERRKSKKAKKGGEKEEGEASADAENPELTKAKDALKAVEKKREKVEEGILTVLKKVAKTCETFMSVLRDDLLMGPRLIMRLSS